MDEKMTEVASTEPDDKKIDEAVKRINEIANKTVYNGMIEIGKYLLKTFFNGNIEEARSKNPQKRTSYRKLCERDDLVISPNTFGKAIRVAAQEKFLEENKQKLEGLEGIDLQKLSYTHKAELTKINDDNDKINAIQECINKNWSTRKLSEHIQKINMTEKIKISATMATNIALKKIKSIPNASDFKNIPTADNYKKLRESSKKKVRNNINDMSKEIDNRIKELTKLKERIEKITAL